MNYNTPGGKLNRGLSVVDTYQILVGKPLEEEVYMKVSILGWAVELVRYFYTSRIDFSYKLTFLLRTISWTVPLLEEDNRVGTNAYVAILLSLTIAKCWLHRNQRCFHARSSNLFLPQKALP